MRRIILLLLLPIFSFAQTRQSGGISFTPQWNYKIAAGDTTWQFGNTLMSPQQFPYVLTKWQSDQRYAPIAGGGYVPYTGATSNLNLGSHTITALSFTGAGTGLTGTGASFTSGNSTLWNGYALNISGLATNDILQYNGTQWQNVVNTYSSPLLHSAGNTSIQVANTSQGGYLSATDWNTFNDKQVALSGTGFAYFTGATPSYIAGNGTGNVVLTTSPALVTPTADYLKLTGLLGSAATPTGNNIALGTLAGGQTFAFKGSSGFSAGFSAVNLTASRAFELPDASTTLIGTDNTATLTNKIWNGVVIGETYGGAGTVNGILKANGSGTVSQAVSNTDYLPVTSPVMTGASTNNLSITGAGGTGFVNLGGTTTVAATPSSGMTLFSRSTNRLSLLGTNGFEALIGTTAYTVGHIVSLPDASGFLMTNPLTTAGDIPYLSASSSAGTNVARRAIGTNGFLLGAVSGLPDYIDPATITVGTVTTNANLTGPITSVGNATSVASQTGTGTKFVMDTSPTLVTPTSSYFKIIDTVNPLLSASNTSTTSTELITATNDRTFAGANNWTGTNWTFSGGFATHTAGSAVSATLTSANLTSNSIVIGREYVVTATFSSRTAGNMNFALGGTAVLASSLFNGTASVVVTAGANNADLTVTVGTTTDGSFTNISIKAVTPSFNIANNRSLYLNSNANTLFQGFGGTSTVKPDLLNIQRSTIGQGTISVTASGTTVTGTGTDFVSYFNVGDVIYANGEAHTITAVSGTLQTLTTDAWTSTFSGAYGTVVGNSLTYNSLGKTIYTSNNVNGNVFTLSNALTNINNGSTLLSSNINYSNTLATNNGAISAGSFSIFIPVTSTQNLTNSNSGITPVVSSGTFGGAGTITRAGNFYSSIAASATTISDVFISRAGSFSNSGTITNFTGYNTPALSGGTITNQTDFLAGALNFTGNWGFANATSKNNFLGTGNTQIGSATATAGAEKLQVTGLASITKMYSGLIGTDSIMVHGSDGKLKVVSPTAFSTGAPTYTITTTTDANYTITGASDGVGSVVKLVTPTSSRTVSLPTASSFTGQSIIFFNYDVSGVNVWTISSGNAISGPGGGTTTSLGVGGFVTKMISDGTNWVVY